MGEVRSSQWEQVRGEILGRAPELARPLTEWTLENYPALLYDVERVVGTYAVRHHWYADCPERHDEELVEHLMALIAAEGYKRDSADYTALRKEAFRNSVIDSEPWGIAPERLRDWVGDLSVKALAARIAIATVEVNKSSGKRRRFVRERVTSVGFSPREHRWKVCTREIGKISGWALSLEPTEDAYIPTVGSLILRSGFDEWALGVVIDGRLVRYRTIAQFEATREQLDETELQGLRACLR